MLINPLDRNKTIGRELIAYEAYWSRMSSSFKSAARDFNDLEITSPSLLVTQEEIEQTKQYLLTQLEKIAADEFFFSLRGDDNFPKGLEDAEHPVQAMYYQGDWALLRSPKRIAIIGSRRVSPRGVKRTQRLARLLSDNGFVIFSGLAEGVDTAAHKAAIENGGKTVAVIGTPITEVYPRSNRTLQKRIARDHCIVSFRP